MSGRYNNVGYGGQGNPYDQRDNSYDPNGYHQGGYSSNYGQGGDVEMQPYGGAGYRDNSGPTNSILSECAAIKREIESVNSQISDLERTYNAAGQDSDHTRFSSEIDRKNASVNAACATLIARMRKVKSQPESLTPTNQGQVKQTEAKLRELKDRSLQAETRYRKRMEEQAARQYRIVNPEADEREAAQAGRDVIANGDGIFQQALMNGQRVAQAQTVLNNVRSRHEDIQKIERQMLELAQLFQDLDNIVMEQQTVVDDIAQKTEETHTNVEQSNVELGHAINSARGARKKKWICLGIIVLILIIIAIVVAVVVTNSNKGTDKATGN